MKYDPDYGQDFAAAEEARAEELSRAQEAGADADAQAEADRYNYLDEAQAQIIEHYQSWTPCQVYGHVFEDGRCADCSEIQEF
jgi:hypothetical protein